LIFAAAVAARTRQVQLSCVVVLPLHDPLRLAEDAAVVDLVSGGRLELTLAAGYVAREFAMFGHSLDERVPLVEEGIEVLRAAWSGEPFQFRGRSVRVTPHPHTAGGPRLVLGGSSPGAARRAARIADGFFPTAPALWDVYRQACIEAGRDPGPQPVRSPLFVHATEEPDSAWAAIAPHAMHENASYAAWIAEAGLPAPFAAAGDAAELRSSGRYVVLTPDECIELARNVDLLELHPLMGGMPPALGWQSLRLFTDQVLPALRPGDT
jgi:alkanesulfonate monooxygenase SsuD/methylene tetrahydromethanopterin reductase-like flavin-dependent oxidoreductase (luciferase family)